MHLVKSDYRCIQVGINRGLSLKTQLFHYADAKWSTLLLLSACECGANHLQAVEALSLFTPLGGIARTAGQRHEKLSNNKKKSVSAKCVSDQGFNAAILKVVFH